MYLNIYIAVKLVVDTEREVVHFLLKSSPMEKGWFMAAKQRAQKEIEQGKGILIERVQTGIRLEKRLLKVLKGLAEYHDMTLGDLLEGIVLHAFDGKHPFGEETRQRIADLKRIYKLDLDSTASHRLLEKLDQSAAQARPVRVTSKRKK